MSARVIRDRVEPAVIPAMSAMLPILLQKSFCRRCYKFGGPQALFSCKDLRDLIASR
jgi:hypothetical protein